MLSSSEKILLYNFFAYFLVALYFLYKDQFKLNVKNVGFFWLAFSAFSSYLFYIQPGFERTVHYSIMSPEPFVYLFPCLILIYLPLRLVNSSNVSWYMEFLPRKKIELIIKIFVPMLLFLFIAYSYQVMHTSLMNMSDIRQDLYDGHFENPFFKSWFGATIDRIYEQTKVLLYCLSFYCLACYKEKTFLMWLFIFLPYIVGFEHAFSTATRSTIFFILMLILLQYLLYRNLFEEASKKRFKILVISFTIFVIILLILMSVSRFEDNVSLFYYKYAGESMINFNGLLFHHVKGTTDGLAYFWYIPYKLGLVDASISDLSAKWFYIESKTGVPGQYFYTIVGSLIFEFGKKWTYVIIFFIFLLERHLFFKRMNALMLVFSSWVMYHLVCSVFYLSIQGDGGVMSLLWLTCFYKWMQKGEYIN